MIYEPRPIHSVKMITWFSDRSGMASTGVFFTAKTPYTGSVRLSVLAGL